MAKDDTKTFTISMQMVFAVGDDGKWYRYKLVGYDFYDEQMDELYELWQLVDSEVGS